MAQKETVFRLTALILAFVMTGAVVAQNAENADALERDVFAPFVSRLRVAVRDPQIRLTWRDAADLSGGQYLVYRHTTEINETTIDDAELVATVEAGIETYLDTPLEAGSYYYAVLAAEPDGRLYPIFVPFRNKTIRAVAIERLETEEDLAASIYDIEAIREEDAILVRFDASRSGRSLVVYRSSVPFDELASISDATQIDSFDSVARRFVDYPVPGVDYYYGVFDAALVERGSIVIEPGENVLAEPIQIALAGGTPVAIEVPAARMRPAPLPILQITRGTQSGGQLAAQVIPNGGLARPISAQTTEGLAFLLASAPQPPRFVPEPVVLPGERDLTGEGATRTLAQIVNTDFADGRYAQAADLLRNLLELPLSAPVEARVRFYLGQSLFLDGRSEPAFMEFVIASESGLYAEARPWIDGILTRR